MDDDEQFAVSYQGVSPGVPVLTRDGKQFGILEHVLEDAEEDVFDGIVVWTGGGGWLDRRVQRDLSRDEKSPARGITGHTAPCSAGRGGAAGASPGLVQTLVLGSERFDCLPGLLDRDPADTHVVYVPTAADVLADQAYVQQELHVLAGMGFPVTILLGHAQLVFVTGGNAFHLLRHAIASGFTDLVPPLVRSGALVYAGLSAGAHLVTPDLLPGVSENTRWKAPDLATTSAMGLVPFSVLAHYGDPDRAGRHHRLLTEPQPRQIVPVTDEQLIVVRGAGWSVIPAAPLSLSTECQTLGLYL
jgi:dipeptidase E